MTRTDDRNLADANATNEKTSDMKNRVAKIGFRAAGCGDQHPFRTVILTVPQKARRYFIIQNQKKEKCLQKYYKRA